MDDDDASRAAGIEMVGVGEGRPVNHMTVRADMVCGHAFAHGSLIFILADPHSPAPAAATAWSRSRPERRSSS